MSQTANFDNEKSILQALFDADPVFAFLYRRILAKRPANDTLSEAIASYLIAYLDANTLTLASAMRTYERFINAYNRDCKAFVETGKYPPELTGGVRGIERIDYDIVLLLSCLVSPHRYRMMEALVELSPDSADEAIFVGCGPGLEIALLDDRFAKVHGFDLRLNPILGELIDGAAFYPELFPSPKVSQAVDAVYMIELLEHVSEPYSLIADAANALKQSGRLYLTTATNIPQFDHLYNFPDDHSEFEAEISRLGLGVVENVEIRHAYIAAGSGEDIGAKNHLYVLERKK